MYLFSFGVSSEHNYIDLGGQEGDDDGRRQEDDTIHDNLFVSFSPKRKYPPQPWLMMTALFCSCFFLQHTHTHTCQGKEFMQDGQGRG